MNEAERLHIYGTTEVEPEARTFTAGPLSVEFVGRIESPRGWRC
jgi:hypothetical protein